MKELKQLSSGQPTSADHINSVIELVNASLEALVTLFNQARTMEINASGISSRLMTRLDEVAQKYPYMFEEKKDE